MFAIIKNIKALILIFVAALIIAIEEIAPLGSVVGMILNGS